MNIIGDVAGNYKTLLAQNGEQGLEMAKAHKPDIIISDWMMPKMSGLQRTRMSEILKKK